ncbi:MAG: carbohydrate-binding family 9-like protein [Chthoniobacteraceae bacterium]|jgi:hypothetical protein
MMESRPPPPRANISAAGAALHLHENMTAARPRQATRVTVARTDANLRIHFQCEDAHPWATITRRDGPLFEEETVEVFLDPFGDLECYFEIEVNPLNTVLDLMLRRVGKGWRKEFAWKCEGLKTSATTSATGWEAALDIPFAAVAPHPPAPGEIWRANFLRIDRPASSPRELSSWSPTGIGTFHVPARFGFLEF